MKKTVLLLLSFLVIGCGSATIHHQVRAGKVNDVQDYIQAGKDLNARCEKSDFQKSGTITTNLYKGDALLETAIRSNNYEIVKMLIDAGADYKQQDKHSRKTYLFMSGRDRDPRIIKLLLEMGLKVNHQDKLGHTALLNHINSGNAENIKLLLKAGAKADMIDWKGWPYILRNALSSSESSIPIFKILVTYGVRLDARNKMGEQAIHFADPREVEYLVKNGVRGPVWNRTGVPWFSRRDQAGQNGAGSQADGK